jgi:hypothetical protein
LIEKNTLVGKISNPKAQEYVTAVYLCENAKISFNELWTRPIKNSR